MEGDLGWREESVSSGLDSVGESWDHVTGR